LSYFTLTHTCKRPVLNAQLYSDYAYLFRHIPVVHMHCTGSGLSQYCGLNVKSGLVVPAAHKNVSSACH